MQTPSRAGAGTVAGVRLVGGIRQDWRRWWAPPDVEIPLAEDMLEDPTGPYGRWLARGLIELDDRQEARCLVLLGDPGSGKSDELERERARWHERGVPVLSVDLGEAPDWSELRAGVFDGPELAAWRTGDGELVLLLDGFDEAQATVKSLSEGLASHLSALPLDRLRLRITGRPSVWPARLTEHLQRLWPESFEVLFLAPLTAEDVRVSARAALGDGDGFLDQVRSRGVGVFAARPITLDMLLVAAGHGPLPDDRVGLYARAIEALAIENHERRVQDRAGGPPVAGRVAAAEILATASLLSGTPRIVRHLDPRSDRRVLAIEDVVKPPVTISDLYAVWDSGLLASASGETLTWTHRSVAEFLCARRIVALPAKTVRHLLSDPESGSDVVPQLAGVAVWAASMDAEVFDWIAATEPALLLTPDLRTAPPARRRRIVQALSAQLTEGRPPSGMLRYGLLDYPELADDVAPLLEPTQPTWIRHEALRFLADNNRRDLDPFLMRLIEEVAAHDQPEADDLGFAEVAALMLAGTPDSTVVTRAATVVANPSAPARLRAELISSFWGHYDLPYRLTIVDWRLLSDRRSPLAGLVAADLSEAARSGTAAPALIVDWLRATSDAGLAQDALASVGGAAVLALAARDDLDDPIWAELGRLCADQAHVGHNIEFWQPDEIALLGQKARRRLVLETLVACKHPGDTLSVRASGLLADEDFEYWLSQYGEALATGDERRQRTARNAVFVLARPTEENLSIAARLALVWPDLEDWHKEWSTPAEIARWQQHQALAATRLAEESTRQADSRFSVTRLRAYVEAGAWSAVTRELRRSTEDHPHGHVFGQPLSSAPTWKMFDRNLTDGVTELAATYLASEPDASTTAGAASVGDAYSLLTAVAPQHLVDLDPDTLLVWLPGLLELPGHADTVGHVITALSPARPREVEEVLLRGIREDAGAKYAAMTSRLGQYSTPAIENALAEAVERDGIDSWVLEMMLAALMARDQERATALAMRLVSERPSSKPDPAVVDDCSDPGLRQWRRAVAAAVVLTRSPVVGTVFDDLLAHFRSLPEFGLAVHGASVSHDGPRAWAALSAKQLATCTFGRRPSSFDRSAASLVCWPPGPAPRMNSPTTSSPCSGDGSSRRSRGVGPDRYRDGRSWGALRCG